MSSNDDTTNWTVQISPKAYNRIVRMASKVPTRVVTVPGEPANIEGVTVDHYRVTFDANRNVQKLERRAVYDSGYRWDAVEVADPLEELEREADRRLRR